MAEYIDLDTPLELYVEHGSFYKKQISTLRDLLDTNRIPYTAADVRPVVKAKWVYTDMSRLVCSNCGSPAAFALKDDGWHYGDFCPNCGADMRGREDERTD